MLYTKEDEMNKNQKKKRRVKTGRKGGKEGKEDKLTLGVLGKCERKQKLNNYITLHIHFGFYIKRYKNNMQKAKDRYEMKSALQMTQHSVYTTHQKNI